MKRLGSSDSLGALMSICPNSTDEHNQGNSNNNPIYTRDFQTMLQGLDEDGCIEESGHVSEKKRRLNVDQVKALEKNFEVENKLEPERKVKLAQELGLQPRQVAVWFQNRRARWKTKQLERDYGVLKANYDGLKINFEKLQHDNEALHKEIEELKSKLNGEDDGKVSVKEEEMASDTEEKSKLVGENGGVEYSLAADHEGGNKITINGEKMMMDLKDGSSDSDSSAILNEENNNSPTAAISSIIHHHIPQLHPSYLNIKNNGSSSSTSNTTMNISFEFSDHCINGGDHGHKSAAAPSAEYQPQFVKIEEHNFLGEESCTTFFSDDQPPSLHWYEWN